MLNVYNTLGRELQEFESLEPDKVKIYQCGPTVYWTQHIGNLRAMVMGDLIRRSLMYLGYQVDFTRNYTDVGHLTDDGDEGEDKMEKGAKREGKTPEEIAAKYIAQFDADTGALNIIPPTYGPKATEYVQHMVDLTQTLLEKGFAYATPKAIYFDISKTEDYTQLSGQKLEHNKQGEGHGDVADSDKRNPQDFSLWFFKTGKHANAIQTWPSPFVSSEVEDGEGFPGWHIECSAMAKSTLGDSIDIHLGGVEHIPIHHTNEIAQSESANGVKFANYWLHNEHLTIDGEKMSKSDGNILELEDFRERGENPIVLRYFFLQAHYRSKQNFTWDSFNAANTAYDRLLRKLSDLYEDDEPEVGTLNQEYRQKFIAAISDDFNIAAGLAVMWEMLKDDEINQGEKIATALDFDQVLGLRLESRLENPYSASDYITAEVEELLKQREQARADKDWAKSDEIRDTLRLQHQLEVQDTDQGQIVMPA